MNPSSCTIRCSISALTIVVMQTVWSLPRWTDKDGEVTKIEFVEFLRSNKPSFGPFKSLVTLQETFGLIKYVLLARKTYTRARAHVRSHMHYYSHVHRRTCTAELNPSSQWSPEQNKEIRPRRSFIIQRRSHMCLLLWPAYTFGQVLCHQSFRLSRCVCTSGRRRFNARHICRKCQRGHGCDR